MRTLLSIWLYGSAFILAAYWYVTVSHLLRARITSRDLGKSLGISLLILLIWPYFLVRWLWCLVSGDLTREVILDPIAKAPNSRNKDENRRR
jgi:hypothetical protein